MNRVGFQVSALIVVLAGVLSPVAATAPPDLSDILYNAIRTNDLASLKALIATGKPAGQDVANQKDGHGETPLMYSAAVGSSEAMQYLLENGARPDDQNDFGSTAHMVRDRPV